MNRRFLIGGTLQHAVSTAVQDWGWQRTHSLRFIDHDGVRVDIVFNAQQLMGMKRGTQVYKGYGFWDRDDVAHLLELDRIGKIELINNG